MKGMNANQVLASEAFDYIIYENPEIEKLLKLLSILAGKGNNRSDEEEGEYQRLKSKFKKKVQYGRTFFEGEIAKEVFNDMRDEVANLEKLLGREND